MAKSVLVIVVVRVFPYVAFNMFEPIETLPTDIFTDVFKLGVASVYLSQLVDEQYIATVDGANVW